MVTGLGHAVAVAGGCKCLMDQLRPGGWWLVANEWSGHSFKICPSIPAAAAAQLGAMTRDIDDAAAEESDEPGEDSAGSRVVSIHLVQ